MIHAQSAYHLLTASIGIDRGDPNPAFRNIDDSRINIEAYGDHLGGW